MKVKTVHKILQEYDQQYKIGRAKLITRHYDVIVAKNLHDSIQTALLEYFSLPKIQEIVKFDFRTNVEHMGDRHIWLDYYDTVGDLQKIYIVLNTKKFKYITNFPNTITINEELISLEESNIDLKIFKEMQDKLLNIFHRGYENQEFKITAK